MSFGLQEFHMMAQLCSAHATVHFVHCKDWVKEVKGASWVDWITDKLGAQEQGLQEDADAIEEVCGLCWCAVGRMSIQVHLHPHSFTPSNVESSVVMKRIQAATYHGWLRAAVACAVCVGAVAGVFCSCM
jgi:hypothetical protein